MRARNLKPGFFQNEALAELSMEARLLFAGLWCMADREGRLEDRPKRIKMQIFPADTIDVEPLLQGLAGEKLIVRYEAEGAACIWIPCFTKHQKPHHREVASTIPPYLGDAQAGARPDLGTAQPPLNPSSLNPPSLNPSSMKKAKKSPFVDKTVDKSDALRKEIGALAQAKTFR